MKRLSLVAALALPLAFSGCQPPLVVNQAVTGICADLNALPVSVKAALDAQDPHSALGVYWANAKAGCANGVPTVGVNQTWTAMMLAAVKALAPVVLPWLIGLL